MAKYWCGEVPKEDDFGCPIEHKPGSIFYDGRTRIGVWGFMTVSSWLLEGCGRTGMGCGQKYQMQKDGRWLKIEG